MRARKAPNGNGIKEASLEVCALISGAQCYFLRDAKELDPVEIACISAILTKAYEQAVQVTESMS